MIVLCRIGHCPKKGLRIDHDSELIAYAAMKTTMAIFHRSGGATTFFSPGRITMFPNQ